MRFSRWRFVLYNMKPWTCKDCNSFFYGSSDASDLGVSITYILTNASTGLANCLVVTPAWMATMER